MKERLSAPVAILLLASLTFACSILPFRKLLGWHITLEVAATVPDREAATLQAVQVLEARLDALALRNAQVEIDGAPAHGRIRVSLPDVPDREHLKRLLTSPGRLEFAHVISPPSPAPVQSYQTKEAALASLGKPPRPDRRVLPYSERLYTPENKSSQAKPEQKWLVVESPDIIDGSELRNAVAVPSLFDVDVYQIMFSLKASGAKKFGDWTGSHIKQYLSVIFNDEVQSVVYIQTRISDNGEINGRFTRQAAEDVALILRSGALPEVRIVEEGGSNLARG